MHPYEILHRKASEVSRETYNDLKKSRGNADILWSNPKKRAESINAFVRREAEKRCKEIWDNYRRSHYQQGKPHHPALEEDWGMTSFRYHRHLTRAQATILFQCRSSAIGLKSHLYSLGVRVSTLRTFNRRLT
jgi:hypothetical protein